MQRLKDYDPVSAGSLVETIAKYNSLESHTPDNQFQLISQLLHLGNLISSAFSKSHNIPVEDVQMMLIRREEDEWMVLEYAKSEQEFYRYPKNGWIPSPNNEDGLTGNTIPAKIMSNVNWPFLLQEISQIFGEINNEGNLGEFIHFADLLTVLTDIHDDARQYLNQS